MNRLKVVVLVALLVALGSAQTRILLCDFEARGSIDTSLVRISAQLLEDALNATYSTTVLRPGPGSRATPCCRPRKQPVPPGPHRC